MVRGRVVGGEGEWVVSGEGEWMIGGGGWDSLC